MSIFREHKSSADRSAADRKRHKAKIDKAIREGIKDVIADESIIGQDGNKKVKIPVKGIKEYQFVYGENDQNKKAGSAGDKQIKRGQVLRKKGQKGKGKPDKAGKDAGEEYYEVEVSLEELAEYLFADLELHDLEKKKFKFIKDKKLKRSGYRKKGMRTKLAKKETIKRKIRRKKRALAAGTWDPESGERFPFHEDDLKFKHMKEKTENTTSAVIYFLMDVSGSMGKQKKYLARSFYFILYQFLRYKYDNIEVVFISHSTDAKEVTEKDFFEKASTGGTLASSALELEREIIQKRFHPSVWNIYTFYSGDGENWSFDNQKAVDLFLYLKETSQMTCYAEINPTSLNDSSFRGGMFYGTDNDDGSLWRMLHPLVDPTFRIIKISESGHIWPAFQKMFGGEK